MPKASVHPVMFRGMMTLKNYTQCCKLDIKTTPAPSLHIIHLQTELTDTKFFQTLRLIPKMSKKQSCVLIHCYLINSLQTMLIIIR